MNIPIELLISIGAGLVAAITGLFALLQQAHTAAIASLVAQLAERDAHIASLTSILKASLFANEHAVNLGLTSQGLPAFVPLAPVVPESNSPSTVAQVHTADIATARARVVAVFDKMGIDPAVVMPPPGVAGH